MDRSVAIAFFEELSCMPATSLINQDILKYGLAISQLTDRIRIVFHLCKVKCRLETHS